MGVLLQIVDHATGRTYLPGYDGNGNVASLVKADNWFTKSGMAPEGSGEHLYDPGRWVEQHLGGTVARFTRTFVNAVSKIHDWQNSWGYDSVGRFVSRSELYNTGFQAYSMMGMPVAGLRIAAILAGGNAQVQQQYFTSRGEGG